MGRAEGSHAMHVSAEPCGLSLCVAQKRGAKGAVQRQNLYWLEERSRVH